MANVVKSVENLEISLSTAQTSNTGTLTKSQTAANCVPFVTIKHTRNTEELFDSRLVDVTISGSTVTVTRAVTGTAVVLTAHVSIVEFDSTEVTVQSGTFQITDTNSSTTSSPGTDYNDITDVFMLFTYTSTSTTDDYDDSMVSGQVTNTTTLTFNRHGGVSGQIDGHWYSVEADSSQFSVQRGSITLNNTNDATATITSVDMSKTFMLCSVRTNEISDDWDSGIASGFLLNATTVKAVMGAQYGFNPDECVLEYQVVTFASGQPVNVQRSGQFTSFIVSPDDVLEKTIELQPLDPDTSTPTNPNVQGLGDGESSNGDDIGAIHAMFKFDADDNLNCTVVSSMQFSDLARYFFEVIEWVVTEYTVDGITKDNDGNALGSCDCYLFAENGADAIKFVAHTTSHATTGAYSFTVHNNDAKYLVYAFKDNTPHVFDVTDHVLTPTV